VTIDRVGEAIGRNDLDELTRIVDDLARDRRWDELLVLRDRTRRAFDESGRQLWPAASFAEYRVALHGPDALLGDVLTPDAGFLAPGPLTEVAAQHHSWADAGPYLPVGPMTAVFAHERAVRGELIDELVDAADVYSAPLRRARWEPEYLLPEYRTDGVEIPSPDPVRGRPLTAGNERAKPIEEHDACDALRAVVAAWATASDARVAVAAVEGGVGAAIEALGAVEARGAWLSPQEALIRLAWAGASGGARGRRRGGAAGRDAAWQAAIAIAGFDPFDTVPEDELSAALDELRWCAWHAADALVGHVLRIAVEDPLDGIAFAIDAVDPA